MKTLRKLLYLEVIQAVALVTAGFMALFFFFDAVDELQTVNRLQAPGYQATQALLYVVMMIPSHIYELFPITVLIGTIFVMARLARSSEFTILRTSGLGPGRALRSLTLLGLSFVLFTFVIGDYVAPLADKTAQMLKSQAQGRISIGKTGAWLKERQAFNQFAVNVGALTPDSTMQDIRIFEFDRRGFIVSLTQAASASVQGEAWLLNDVERTEFLSPDTDASQVSINRVDSLRWPSQISAEMVAAAVLKPERMGTWDLFQYIRHLTANGQTAQKYEIQFWKKLFYPMSCLVMVVLALPFAYLHFRSGSISGYTFVGVMAGISFVLLNNVMNDMGNLRGWDPLLSAALPSLLYGGLSLSVFTWLVLRR
ncbi:LPS export ABC transporter permease LptG [Curvibacter sp. CHRR-16]|uniref:LPS export ABC transporter permease LptG n=1 Tax=Curvibacter sp. CHRR-16 TaxID=2835872 RepID=UPI001BD9CF94|nr:LPS export ABC transporter permease LptG [Curvibacter sp. CHRR-16]MBT0571231.1 LPS export ABC transporter permease LptG [Curvibacter sp. CHRR-16]